MSRTIVVLVAACFVWAAGPDAQDALAREEALLQVTERQLPTDIGSDGLTKFTLEDEPRLGGKALKVVYAAGDSFGDRAARVKDWKPFVALEFQALNPAATDVRLTLTVKHRRTTSYQTRVDVPIVLKPGKNSVRLGIDEMLNVNGTVPDLGNVDRWYIACEPGTTPTLWFGDLWLVGGDEPAAAAASAAGPPAAGPARAYRVTGKIGGMDVDLTVTPLGSPAAAAARPSPDPARLARIRAAKMPAITGPVMFDTPEADAILGALEVFPPDNPWNLVVEDWPLHPNSKRMIESIGADKPLRYNPDMAFVLVPADQKRVEVKLVGYPDESDPGPYPVPDNVPIEGWPAGYQREAGGQPAALDDVQRDKAGRGGDRHAIVVDPVGRTLYEFFMMRKTDAGWEAAQASVFDLSTNRLRPDGWTSSDAAGLPIFPAVVRYDELRRGMVEHAMRVTVRNTRRAYVAPATHFASRHDNEDYPRMGERIRLRGDFDVSGFSPEVQAILKGLKKYGMFVADNGIEWAISVTPDPRIPSLHEELRRLRGSDFEVVVRPPQ
jgi:hypothetical protein